MELLKSGNNKQVFGLAVSIGLTALVMFYLKNQRGATERSYETIDVIVAATDIPPRSRISQNDIALKQMPARYMEPGSVMVKSPELDFKKVIGKVTLASIPAGAQISTFQLMRAGPNTSGLSPIVPKNHRGYLLRLGNLDVSDLIVPGDRIDIMGTFPVRNKEGQQMKAAYTVLQNVLVLGVGKEFDKTGRRGTDADGNPMRATSLTLSLSPIDAQRLALAQAEAQGDLTVIIRPAGDTQFRDLPGIDSSNLLQ